MDSEEKFSLWVLGMCITLLLGLGVIVLIAQVVRCS